MFKRLKRNYGFGTNEESQQSNRKKKIPTEQIDILKLKFTLYEL